MSQKGFRVCQRIWSSGVVHARDKNVEADMLCLGSSIHAHRSRRRPDEYAHYIAAMINGKHTCLFSRSSCHNYLYFYCLSSNLFSECTSLHILDAWYHVFRPSMGSFRFQLGYATAAHIIFSHASPMSRTCRQRVGSSSQPCRQNTTHTKQRHGLNHI